MVRDRLRMRFSESSRLDSNSCPLMRRDWHVEEWCNTLARKWSAARDTTLDMFGSM